MPAEWWWPNSLPIRYKPTRRKNNTRGEWIAQNSNGTRRRLGMKRTEPYPDKVCAELRENFRVELFPTTGGSPTDPAKLLSSKVAFYDAQPPKPIPAASSRSRAIRGGLIQRRQRKVVYRAELSWRPGYIPRSRTPSNKEMQRLAIFSSTAYLFSCHLLHHYAFKAISPKSIDQPCPFPAKSNFNYGLPTKKNWFKIPFQMRYGE
jgi:hypothetical protein